MTCSRRPAGSQVEANRCETARARATTRLFQHLQSDVQARRAEDPHFTQPPLTETIIETQPLTGQTCTRPATTCDLDHWVYGDAGEHGTPPITHHAPINWDTRPTDEQVTPLAS